MFARMSRKSAVLFPCLAATFSSANKPTCKYLWEEALEELTSLASSILNVDFESTHGMKILQRRLRYVLRKRRYWNTTDCVISSLQHVWKPLIQENFTKLSYLSQVDFCHSTSLQKGVIKIDLITNQLKSKFICDRSAHWIHFKIPLILLFWKRQIMYLC